MEWIIAGRGYEAFPAMAMANRIDFPEARADTVVMDYQLTGQPTAVQAAKLARQRYPVVPIVVLSGVYDLPSEVVPYAHAFVRKGEPAKLVDPLAQCSAKPALQPDNAA